MATNYSQDGKTITYANTGGTAIASGAVVVVGNQIGVALVDIPATTGTGAVIMEGVFSLPKAAGAAINQGTSPIWDASAGGFIATVTLATGDVSNAVTAWATAAAADTTVLVKLNTGKGTLT